MLADHREQPQELSFPPKYTEGFPLLFVSFSDASPQLEAKCTCSSILVPCREGTYNSHSDAVYAHAEINSHLEHSWLARPPDNFPLQALLHLEGPLKGQSSVCGHWKSLPSSSVLLKLNLWSHLSPTIFSHFSWISSVFSFPVFSHASHFHMGKKKKKKKQAFTGIIG